ncbi:unnamed protein product [Gadus morhua 'NCC']
MICLWSGWVGMVKVIVEEVGVVKVMVEEVGVVKGMVEEVGVVEVMVEELASTMAVAITVLNGGHAPLPTPSPRYESALKPVCPAHSGIHQTHGAGDREH